LDNIVYGTHLVFGLCHASEFNGSPLRKLIIFAHFIDPFLA